MPPAHDVSPAGRQFVRRSASLLIERGTWGVDAQDCLYKTLLEPPEEAAPALAALRAEARVLALLPSLPNLPRLLQAPRLDSPLVQSLPIGCPVASLPAASLRDADVALRLALGLLTVLEAVHEAGVVHGQVGPETVLVDPQSAQISIIDFDRALRLPPIDAPAPVCGAAIDGRSDLQAVGALLCWCLNGGAAVKSIETLTSLDPPLSAPLMAVLHTLLVEQAGERYQSVRGLRADLQHCQRSNGETDFVAGAQDHRLRPAAPSRLLRGATELTALTASPDCHLLEAYSVSLGQGPIPESREALSGHAQQLRGARILLVDDDPISQELAADLLTRAGMLVTLADDGQQALAAIDRQEFDGVLMDCQMPVMDGYAATRRLRHSPRWQSLPVIAMTANAISADRDRALAAGMNDHIATPIDVAAMFETIARWVHPRAEAQEDDGETVTDPLGSLPGIDSRVGRATTGGNDALYRRLLLKLRDGQRDFVQQFAQAQERGDIKSAMRLAHDLQGVAGLLGAETVHYSAKALEAACRHGVAEERVDAQLAVVARDVATVIRGLESLSEEE